MKLLNSTIRPCGTQQIWVWLNVWRNRYLCYDFISLNLNHVLFQSGAVSTGFLPGLDVAADEPSLVFATKQEPAATCPINSQPRKQVLNVFFCHHDSCFHFRFDGSEFMINVCVQWPSCFCADERPIWAGRTGADKWHECDQAGGEDGAGLSGRTTHARHSGQGWRNALIRIMMVCVGAVICATFRIHAHATCIRLRLRFAADVVRMCEMQFLRLTFYDFTESARPRWRETFYLTS